MLVLNLTDKPRTLYKGTRIGEAHPITDIQLGEVMTYVDNWDYPDESDESDDDD